MAPFSSFADIVGMRRRNAELLTKGDAAKGGIANSTNIIIAQLARIMRKPSMVPAPSLAVAFPIVFGLRPPAKVGWVYARRIIARVQSMMFARRTWPPAKDKADMRCLSISLTFEGKDTVAVSYLGRCPNPATAGLVDLGPKSGFYFWRDVAYTEKSHSVLQSRSWSGPGAVDAAFPARIFLAKIMLKINLAIAVGAFWLGSSLGGKIEVGKKP